MLSLIYRNLSRTSDCSLNNLAAHGSAHTLCKIAECQDSRASPSKTPALLESSQRSVSISAILFKTEVLRPNKVGKASCVWVFTWMFGTMELGNAKNYRIHSRVAGWRVRRPAHLGHAILRPGG